MTLSLLINKEWLYHRYAGITLSVLLGISALALAERYNSPVMLLAILIGLALHPVYSSQPLQAGIHWCARPLLLIGVALLGFRVDISALQTIGVLPPIMTLACLALTIIVGTLTGKKLGISTRFSLLISGAVAVCGVSAAVAISAVMPKDSTSEKELTLTVAGVTGMSTLTMILYPIISQWIGHNDTQAGIFLGASIHDVAQVVGAGYSISDSAGDTAAFVKLIRVSALLPVVLVISYFYGKLDHPQSNSTWQLIPPFLLAYTLIAITNSLHIWPESLQTLGSDISKLCLVISLVAIGLKTDLKEVASVGKKPLIALALVTVLMAALALFGIILLP